MDIMHHGKMMLLEVDVLIQEEVENKEENV